MLRTALLVLLGLALIGTLSAVLEQLGIKNPYWSKSLAAVLVIIAALTHTWARLLIVTGLAILYIMVRRNREKRVERMM